MKGPYQRVKFDLRRLWECPVCNRRERTAGSVTFRHCQCQMQRLDGQPVVMKLIADGVQRLVPPIAIPHEEACQVTENQGTVAPIRPSETSTEY